MRTDKLRLSMVLLMVGTLCACGANAPGTISPEETEATAREAYVYGFPMVMTTRLSTTT